MTREELHDALDRQLDAWKYGDRIPIDRGMIRIEVQIDQGKQTITISERALTREAADRR